MARQAASELDASFFKENKAYWDLVDSDKKKPDYPSYLNDWTRREDYMISQLVGHDPFRYDEAISRFTVAEIYRFIAHRTAEDSVRQINVDQWTKT